MYEALEATLKAYKHHLSFEIGPKRSGHTLLAFSVFLKLFPS